MAKKQMQLNFFENAGLGNASCAGQWKYDHSWSLRFDTILTCHRNPLDKVSTKDRAQYYIDLAKLAEKGKISCVFFTDSYGHHEVYESSISATLAGAGPLNNLDPFLVVPSMALATKYVGFCITTSTSYISKFLNTSVPIISFPVMHSPWREQRVLSP